MLVITGNPGVGKKTVAKAVAKKLALDLVDVNQVALKNKAIESRDRYGYLVDLKKLSSILKRRVGSNSLVVGHLAPYVLKEPNPKMVAVVRRSPYELETVYRRRGYSRKKIIENLSSETIGVSLYDAIARFGKRKVAEFDATSKNPYVTANQIIMTYNGQRVFSIGKIDWLSLVAKNDDMQKFFEYRTKRA